MMAWIRKGKYLFTFGGSGTATVENSAEVPPLSFSINTEVIAYPCM